MARLNAFTCNEHVLSFRPPNNLEVIIFVHRDVEDNFIKLLRCLVPQLSSV